MLRVNNVTILIALFFVVVLFTAVRPFDTPAATDADSFVTRNGTKFYLNGKEFKFVGFNLFDAAATDSYKCGWWARFSDSELDATLKYMRATGGASVLRFWAFQKYTRSGQDWSGMDRVMRIAKQNGFKVIPVLENGPGACTGNPSMEKWQYQSDTWYVSGYKTKFGTDALSYRDYVKAVVTRYKDEPAILGWMMMNEANTGKRTSAGKTVLIDFVTDIGSLIKSIDTKHLVTVGTQSNGATAGSGKDFVDLYSLPQIDFTSAIERGYWTGKENDPLPGSSDGKTLPSVTSADCVKTYGAKVACSLANAIKVVKKPFVIADAGIKVENTPVSRQQRATVMNLKMKAMFSNGASGYMLWQWNKMIDDQKFDIVQSQNDPLLPTMKAYSGYLPVISTPAPAGTPPVPLTTGANTVVERGVNLFGGWQSLYGNVDSFATPAQLDYFKSKGLNTFRVGFRWESLQPTLNGAFNTTYLAKMDKLVADARVRGQKLAFVPLPGTWKGNQVGSAALPQAAFNDLWIKLATRYKNEPAIWGYNLLNEPNMGIGWNITIAPSAIAAIRTVDKIKPIIVPTSTGGYGHNHKYHLTGLPMQDASNNLIYEAHFYFDTPADGVYAKGFDVPNANLNIGVDRAKDFVEWCVANNQKCYAGEYGVPGGWKVGTPTCLTAGGTNNDPRWLTVLDRFLTYLDQNNISGTYWAGGPYGDVSSVGPFCNAAGQFFDGPQMAILTKHLSRPAAPSMVAAPAQAQMLIVTGDISSRGDATYNALEDVEYVVTVDEAIIPGEEDLSAPVLIDFPLPRGNAATAITGDVTALIDVEATPEVDGITMIDPDAATAADGTPVINDEAGIVVNDTSAGITMNPPSGTLAEGSTTAYSVVLNTKPAADVSITLTSPDPSLLIDPVSLTLTPLNWNVPQTVTLTLPAAIASAEATGSESEAESDTSANTENTDPNTWLRLAGIGVMSEGLAGAAKPGDTATWTFTVENTAEYELTDVEILLDYPDADLSVLYAGSDAGIQGATGDVTTYRLAALPVGTVITLTIETRLPARAGVFVGTMFATVNGIPTPANASLSLLVVGELPASGEIPWWRSLAASAGRYGGQWN